jgi:hypothetical protein
MSDLLQRLERANRTLGMVLDLMSAGEQLAITPDHLAGILTELLQVGECLQDRDAVATDPEVDTAIRQYRGQLEQLRALMPSLHARLLTERVRLEAERSHLESANSWAEISHTTR